MIGFSLGLFLALLLTSTAFAKSAKGNPSNYLAELISRAKTTELADQRTWHLLLHYRPNVTGGYTSQADDPDFFLSTNGKNDPYAELEATLRAIFSSNKIGSLHQSAPCAFIARYHWLQSQLSIEESRLPPFHCEHFSHWYRELKPLGVTLVFPSSYLNNPSSMFAHTFLRIDQEGQTEETQLLAYSINFAAQPTTDLGIMYAVHGLTGGFQGRFSTKPYYLKVKEYGDIENRDIWEYQLRLNQEQIRFMLMHVWELQLTYFDYFFFKENCAYQILALLEVAVPEWHLTDQFILWTIPAETVRLLTQRPGFVQHIQFHPARTTTIRRKLERLSGKEKNVLTEIIDDSRAVKTSTIIQELSPQRQGLVLDLAIDYFQYHNTTREETDVTEELQLHRLLGTRSDMDVRSPSVPVPPFSTQPELGHRPARAGIGGGWRNDESFEEVTLRAGYHDLLDPDPGFPPYSQIVLGSLAVRHYNKRNRTRLERLTFANIVSLTPMDMLIKAPSWKLRFELDTVKFNGCRYCRNINLNGGLGLTLESQWIHPIVFFALPELDANYSDAYDGDYRIGGGSTVGM
ncbi:MAG: DUF4105 domain-containing protein, partial [Nitrospirota bacterium]|nr:DUF4105 domain-containing protein [Nitrospirota bacterium]MDX2419444.1 DUF4105 domain-containing protein [Nitrospirota bacterium]